MPSLFAPWTRGRTISGVTFHRRYRCVQTRNVCFCFENETSYIEGNAIIITKTVSCADAGRYCAETGEVFNVKMTTHFNTIILSASIVFTFFCRFSLVPCYFTVGILTISCYIVETFQTGLASNYYYFDDNINQRPSDGGHQHLFHA